MTTNTINGTSDADFLNGTSAGDLINGLAGDDFIRGRAGADVLNGDADNDLITGGADNDSLYGGSENDTLDGEGGDDLIDGGPGDDELNGGRYFGGGDGQDTLIGGAGNDLIISDGIAAQDYDEVIAGPGDDEIQLRFDYFRPMGGSIDGGADTDLLVITSSDSQYTTPPNLPLVLSIGASPGGSYDGGTLAITNIERLDIQSSIGDDTITGGDLDDLINARDGANSVFSGDGDDLITVFAGSANVIDGGAGDDTLSFGFGPNTTSAQVFSLDASGATVTEGNGSTITGIEHFFVRTPGQLDHTVIFGGGNDSLLSANGDDSVEGGAGDDTITTGRGADTVRGGEDDDHIIGGTGSFNSGDAGDLIFGDGGNDTLEGDEGMDVIDGGAGNDVLMGGYLRFSTEYGDKMSDTLRGGAGDDELHEGFNGGKAEGDFIYGQSGNDKLFLEGRGASFVNGGSGIDTVVFANRSSDYDVNFTIVGADTAAGIVSDGYTLKNVERLELTLFGGDNTIEGGALDDLITVEDGENIIKGNAGDDIISVDVGTPLIFDGLANDVDGGAGFDVLRYEDSSKNVGVDLVVAAGTATDDHGGTYANFERYEVSGSSAPDSAVLGDGADRFIGRQGNDTAFGGAGRDVLSGGGQDDFLSGGGGWDVILGGNGVDTLTGGAGADKFRFGSDQGTVDIITDFEVARDRIIIRMEGLGEPDPGSLSVIDATDFALGAATSASGQFVFTDDGTDGLLSWDANGTAAGGITDIVTLEGVTFIAHSDIYIF